MNHDLRLDDAEKEIPLQALWQIVQIPKFDCFGVFLSYFSFLYVYQLFTLKQFV